MADNKEADGERVDEIIIYSGKDGDVRVQMRFTGADVWMSQLQMAELFGVGVPTINEHLANVFNDGELDETATIRNFRIVRTEGARQVAREVKHYNLDAIISVGYRVSSKPATRFRIWATRILKEYAVKGHVVDVERLKDPEASDYFQELLEKIRDIRASERHVWKRILELASLCSDYSARDQESLRGFFADLQNALHWGVTSATAAEIIDGRVDASKPNCGVTHFEGAVPTQKEVVVAKNYLGKAELEELNLLTVRLLDFFEDQTNRRLVVTLGDFEDRLKDFLRFDSRPVLSHRGAVTMEKAKAKAIEELRNFKAKLRRVKEAAGEKALKALEAAAGKIAGGKIAPKGKKNRSS